MISSTLDARPLTLRVATRSGGQEGGRDPEGGRGRGEQCGGPKTGGGREGTSPSGQQNAASMSGRYHGHRADSIYRSERCGWEIVRRAGFSRCVRGRRGMHGKPCPKIGGDGSCRPKHISYVGTSRHFRGIAWRWWAGSRERMGGGPRVVGRGAWLEGGRMGGHSSGDAGWEGGDTMEPAPGYNQGDGGAKTVRAYEYEYDRRKRPATALTRASENRDACAIGGRGGWGGWVGGGGGGTGDEPHGLPGRRRVRWGPGMAALGVHGVRRPCPAAELRRAAGAWPSGVRVEAPGYVRDRGEIAAVDGRAGARAARRAVAVSG